MNDTPAQIRKNFGARRDGTRKKQTSLSLKRILESLPNTLSRKTARDTTSTGNVGRCTEGTRLSNDSAPTACGARETSPGITSLNEREGTPCRSPVAAGLEGRSFKRSGTGPKLTLREEKRNRNGAPYLAAGGKRGRGKKLRQSYLFPHERVDGETTAGT